MKDFEIGTVIGLLPRTAPFLLFRFLIHFAITLTLVLVTGAGASVALTLQRSLRFSRRPFHLLLLMAACVAASQPVFARVIEHDSPVSAGVAIKALAQAMRARGLTPPPESDLSLEDYIVSRTAVNSKKARKKDQVISRHVGFWVGPDGQVVPGGEWRQFNPDYCKRRARYFRTPTQNLDFKFIRNTEMTEKIGTRNQMNVHATWSEAGTKIITSSGDGETTNVNRGKLLSKKYIYDALETAFTKADGTTPKAPDDPCGRVRLKHVSGNKVGKPVTFRAGYRGFGKALVYTWDFGDGSAERDGRSLQVPTHTYDRKGTYKVRVKVRELDGETHSWTIQVKIGGGLRLVFSSQINRDDPSGPTHGVSRYEADVPLTSDGDGATYEGSAPLKNTQYASAAMDKAGCTATPRETTLRAQVTMPDPASDASIQAVLNPPNDVKTMSPAIKCSRAMVARMIGKGEVAHIWWPGFVVMHHGWLKDGFHVTDWQLSDATGVVARKVYSDTRALAQGHAVLTEKTTIEIRND